MVDQLLEKYNKNKNPEIKAGDVLVNSKRGMQIKLQTEFKNCNKMTNNDKQELKEIESQMSTKKLDSNKENEKQISEIAWIRYRPRSRNFDLDSFDGRKQKSNSVIRPQVKSGKRKN